MLVVVAVLVVAVLGWVLVTYNSLVRRRNQVRAAWAQIDVQLKRRHDLIPNLVRTVRGYAAHERATLDAVVRARSAAVAANDAAPRHRAETEGQLSTLLGRLMVVTERYPRLKADQNFLALQAELTGTEDKIAYARQFLNTAVRSMNTSVETVPANLVAALGRFRRQEYFEAGGDER